MTPWLHVATLAAGFAVGWMVHGWRTDAAELARQQAEAREAFRRGEIATRAAQQLEVDRAAIHERLRAARADLAAALAAPVPQCPALAVGDVVVPAAALGGLRRAAGQADAAAGQPRPAVPERARDPGG